MDFKWNLNHYLKRNIVKIGNDLIPEGFSGDRVITRACVEAISEVIDRMGIASAKAQGLKNPITTAERHRLSDYELYLLFDPEGNLGNGSVVGMLKMGKKKLYVFNYNGDCHDKVCLCVLDFYVHESRQRQGCGKQLFDHMLGIERITPEKIAIDRPSDKFLSFLLRHYGLGHVIPQNNNFVVFEGFFPPSINNDQKSLLSPSRKLEGGYYSPLQSKNPITYNGRHSAQKPEATIGKCLNWYGSEQDQRKGRTPSRSSPHISSPIPSQ